MTFMLGTIVSRSFSQEFMSLFPHCTRIYYVTDKAIILVKTNRLICLFTVDAACVLRVSQPYRVYGTKIVVIIQHLCEQNDSHNHATQTAPF